ncbi:MAG: GTP pyrophosphokinase, (p)ppGpp synthetase I [Parcubacteria bacterium C7867-001]|nr:MAG: GTP pyrophosphokinase, (p)ppGpp synthetase I [Parcubacteria bacterium C7867-001]
MLRHTLNMPFLKEAQNRETFFRRIAQFLPPHDPRYREIEKAYNDAKDAFRETFRDGGERYFEHLRAVALILIEYLRVKDHHLIVAALMHDSVEDKKEWTIERISSEYGREVALLLEYLSMPDETFGTKHERERIYHERFRFAPREFWFIKLADRLHNLLTLDGRPEDKRRAKIEETVRYYLPYAEQECILIQELEHAIALASAYKPRTSKK